MNKISIIFFGSTDDSVIVLNKLIASPILESQYEIHICAVVTQPPKPIGRKQIITPTPVEIWAKAHDISVLSFPASTEKAWEYADENAVNNALSTFKADLIISASYGQKIPAELLANTPHGGINVHPSILPRWRGADPVPWTIMMDDAQTGVTIVTLSEKFDQGRIIAQQKIPVVPTDTTDPLRTKLFTLGADLLIETLPEYISGKNKGIEQKPELGCYARKLHRTDGFIPWEVLASATQGVDMPREKRGLDTLISHMTSHIVQAIVLLHRALSPWPGLWTETILSGETKRIKILEIEEKENKISIKNVQVEGKTPTSWKQFEEGYSKK